MSKKVLGQVQEVVLLKLPRQEGRQTSTSRSHALTCPTRMRSLFLGPMREHVCEPGTLPGNPGGSVCTRWLQVLLQTLAVP